MDMFYTSELEHKLNGGGGYLHMPLSSMVGKQDNDSAPSGRH